MANTLLWILINLYVMLIQWFFNASSTFSLFLHSRSLPKISSHEEEGVHQNPQYTGHHHFHPVPHDHDFCERVVINVSLWQSRTLTEIATNSFSFSFLFSPLQHFNICHFSLSFYLLCKSSQKEQTICKCSVYFLHHPGIQNIIK